MKTHTDIEQEPIGSLEGLEALWKMTTILSTIFWVAITGATLIGYDLYTRTEKSISISEMRKFQFTFLAVGILVFLAAPWLLAFKKRKNKILESYLLIFSTRCTVCMILPICGAMHMNYVGNILEGIPFVIFAVLGWRHIRPTEQSVRRAMSHSTRNVKVISDT